MNKKGNLTPLYSYKVRSIYESHLLQKAFYLHPGYAQITRNPTTNKEYEMTVLCYKYSKWFQVEQKFSNRHPPSNSIASCVDFGSQK